MSLELLNADNIQAVIATQNICFLAKLEVFDTIDSTNTYLLSRAKLGPSGWACFAERQTQGRGRQGRAWFSPYGKNIYCSLLWRFASFHEKFSGLSIAVAIMVVKALKKYGVPAGIQVKWPNDILFSARKLAGILVERSGNAVVIGVGINLNVSPEAEKTWISLAEIMQQPIARNYFAGLLLNELLANLPLYQTNGLAVFIPEWQQHDFLKEKNITLYTPQATLTGVMQGINGQGELLLQDEEGHQQQFCYGEVSVRTN